jgi:para-nitrobenzyl esterase
VEDEMKLTVKSIPAVLLIPVFWAASSRAQGPVVDTAYGKLRGAVDGDMVAFKGIPFAGPAVGELRWRAP